MTFLKNTQISNLVIICQVEAELLNVDRQMNRHDEGNGCFSQFVNVFNKWTGDVGQGPVAYCCNMVMNC